MPAVAQTNAYRPAEKHAYIKCEALNSRSEVGRYIVRSADRKYKHVRARIHASPELSDLSFHCVDGLFTIERTL